MVLLYKVYKCIHHKQQTHEYGSMIKPVTGVRRGEKSNSVQRLLFTAQSEPVIALSCKFGSLLTVWDLRHQRRPTMSPCVCSPLMISLSLLSGAPRWQTRPEPPKVLILWASVCVCIHAGVWLHENEMATLVCVCVYVYSSPSLGVSINEPRFHFRWAIIWLFIWLRFMTRPYICSLQHCSSL